MTAVNLISLTKRYPGQPAPVLKDFSLSVGDGELVALLGPSGSGKSTLLKLVTGIERPDAGDVHFDGSSILGVSAHKRSAVLMFQKAYLFPFLNVAENIGFGLKMQRTSAETIRAEVGRMLDLIGLPGIERRKPAQLSGGEQQRVALARALVTRPKVLLLDEPLNSLDAEVRLNLQEAIRRIQRELGLTTIFVTHDLGEAMSVSDRMALLLNGEIVAVDRPDRLFHRPPNVAAARFMGVSTFFNGTQAAGRLVTPFGALEVACREEGPHPGHLPKGDGEATYAIRPEHLRVQKEPGENSLAGVVTDCVFRGEFVEYQVALDGMTARARMPMPAPVFARGERVFVCVPAAHLFAVG
jgi:ABC-type Fe3+/spermidine/putrescine transport system ATPase subunit